MLYPRLPPLEGEQLASALKWFTAEAEPVTETDMPCAKCGGVGLPKREVDCQLLDVVCAAMFARFTPERQYIFWEMERDAFMLARLPWFRAWLLNPNRTSVIESPKSA